MTMCIQLLYPTLVSISSANTVTHSQLKQDEEDLPNTIMLTSSVDFTRMEGTSDKPLFADALCLAGVELRWTSGSMI